MRSAAEPSSAALGRSSDLLDQVDYRLAQTPEEKEKIYNLRYRAYLREGAVQPSADQRVTDQYDDLSNSWTFGVHLFGELFSSIRISVLTSEWRQSCSNEAFGEILNPRLDRGEVIIDTECETQQTQQTGTEQANKMNRLNHRTQAALSR